MDLVVEICFLFSRLVPDSVTRPDDLLLHREDLFAQICFLFSRLAPNSVTRLADLLLHRETTTVSLAVRQKHNWFEWTDVGYLDFPQPFQASPEDEEKDREARLATSDGRAELSRPDREEDRKRMSLSVLVDFPRGCKSLRNRVLCPDCYDGGREPSVVVSKAKRAPCLSRALGLRRWEGIHARRARRVRLRVCWYVAWCVDSFLGSSVRRSSVRQFPGSFWRCRPPLR